MSQVKLSPNITAHLPAQTEQLHKNEYEDESESYPNDENLDDETTNQDNSQVFGDIASNNRPDLNPSIPNSNNRKGSDFSTSRIPFVPSNLWRDLFSKPGILVGKFISFPSTKTNPSRFRYYRWYCHWNVIRYITCYVYYLSNA
jgi:hypothetical protein